MQTKRIKLNLLLKLLYMNSKLALTLSYLNPALNNPTQKAGCSNHVRVSLIFVITNIYYFGGARSKGFATLRNVSKLQFFDKTGHAKSVGFRFYSAIWRSESRINSRYLEITSISLIYSVPFWKKKELLFWLCRGLNPLACVTRQSRGDS